MSRPQGASTFQVGTVAFPGDGTDERRAGSRSHTCAVRVQGLTGLLSRGRRTRIAGLVAAGGVGQECWAATRPAGQCRAGKCSGPGAVTSCPAPYCLPRIPWEARDWDEEKRTPVVPRLGDSRRETCVSVSPSDRGVDAGGPTAQGPKLHWAAPEQLFSTWGQQAQAASSTQNWARPSSRPGPVRPGAAGSEGTWKGQVTGIEGKATFSTCLRKGWALTAGLVLQQD